MNAEYDLADLVTDLHHRPREKEHDAAKFNFVYIDEVQDLTMGKIALLRHILTPETSLIGGETPVLVKYGIINTELSSMLRNAGAEQAKRRLQCSELKQLYVAINRTRQRLWILENGDGDGFSEPMCDYWKALQLVKLFNEQKYEHAKMCFERVEEALWAKLAEASGLQATAWHRSTSDSDRSKMYLKNAAQVFNSMGKFETAADCL
ncbi:hypothetical protein TIFTF001_030767 [Ficus carica]|uniref:UvrD-like helicase ATP-binding domain-containing protein n=1 Tax=Ficus carica TaxID=3494 RepID=A0AA88DU72_FICCA|nr:hypothetical protein TIFTF001_030767 [Ficus carica]